MGTGRSAARAVLGIVTSLVVLATGAAASAYASAPAMTPRVINGDPGAADQYPYLVSLLLADRFAEDGAFQAQFCGGTLTSTTTVVTAAHCVVDQKTGDQRAARDILVGFGSNLRESSPQDRPRRAGHRQSRLRPPHGDQRRGRAHARGAGRRHPLPAAGLARRGPGPDRTRLARPRRRVGQHVDVVQDLPRRLPGGSARRVPRRRLRRRRAVRAQRRHLQRLRQRRGRRPRDGVRGGRDRRRRRHRQLPGRLRRPARSPATTPLRDSWASSAGARRAPAASRGCTRESRPSTTSSARTAPCRRWPPFPPCRRRSPSRPGPVSWSSPSPPRPTAPR